MKIQHNNETVEITLKKTGSPSSYSGAFAPYDVYRNGILVGELLPRTSRLVDSGPYHEFITLNKNVPPTPSVSTRGVFRRHLNEYVAEYLG
jgi:hypothetical protein